MAQYKRRNKERDDLILRYYFEGWRQKEIALMVHASYGAVRIALHRRLKEKAKPYQAT